MFFTGCVTVGPDYVEPDLPNVPDSKDQQVDIEQWWNQFNDQTLTAMVEKALDNNHDLKKAVARVRQARAQLVQTRAIFGPMVDLSASTNRYMTSERAPGGDGKYASLHNVGFDAVWEIDLFGGTKRAVEAAAADWQAMQVNMDNVRVTVASETALAYLGVRTYEYRLQVAGENLKTQQETYDIFKIPAQCGLKQRTFCSAGEIQS